MKSFERSKCVNNCCCFLKFVLSRKRLIWAQFLLVEIPWDYKSLNLRNNGTSCSKCICVLCPLFLWSSFMAKSNSSLLLCLSLKHIMFSFLFIQQDFIPSLPPLTLLKENCFTFFIWKSRIISLHYWQIEFPRSFAFF